MHGKGIVRKIGIRGIETIVGRDDGNFAGKNIQLCRLQPLIALRDVDRRACRFLCADLHHPVAVYGIIRSGNVQRAAFYLQQLLRIDRIVHLRRDIECELPNRQGGFPLFLRRCAGFDPIFPVCTQAQRSAAAKGDR